MTMMSRGDHWEFMSHLKFRFNGEMFYVWKFQMQLDFRAGGVLAVVEGTEPVRKRKMKRHGTIKIAWHSCFSARQSTRSSCSSY